MRRSLVGKREFLRMRPPSQFFSSLRMTRMRMRMRTTIMLIM